MEKKDRNRKKKKENTGQKYNGPLLHRAAIKKTIHLRTMPTFLSAIILENTT